MAPRSGDIHPTFPDAIGLVLFRVIFLFPTEACPGAPIWITQGEPHEPTPNPSITICGSDGVFRTLLASSLIAAHVTRLTGKE